MPVKMDVIGFLVLPEHSQALGDVVGTRIDIGPQPDGLHSDRFDGNERFIDLFESAAVFSGYGMLQDAQIGFMNIQVRSYTFIALQQIVIG